MNYVFGPVPSRRLGRSLGVDPIPLKTCNWNCVYCQLGRTTPMTNERREWVPTAELLRQLGDRLSGPCDDIDWVTIVGSGEPTLHIDIGRMIAEAKRLCDRPVAVITNGTLLWMPEVRRDLLPADAVMPTVTAGTGAVYRAMHRPHPECTFERLVEGVRAFRQEYSGKLWIEVMLVAGINDGDDELRSLAALLRTMNPDEVQITLPTRPPCEQWVVPPDEDRLMRAVAILGDVAVLVPPAPEQPVVSDTDPDAAVLAVITRHPMRECELVQLFPSLDASTISAALAALQATGTARPIERYGQTFWAAAGTTFGDTDRTKPPELHRRCGAADEAQ